MCRGRYGRVTATHGGGLQGIQDRVRTLRGSLRLNSPGDGGTEIVVTVPVDRAYVTNR